MEENKFNLIPERNKIPPEFDMMNMQNKWIQLFDALFYGKEEDLYILGKDPEIDKENYTKIRKLMMDRMVKHQHKTSGIAYLLSQAYIDYVWKPKQEKIAQIFFVSDATTAEWEQFKGKE